MQRSLSKDQKALWTGRQRSIWHCDNRCDPTSDFYRLHLHNFGNLKKAAESVKDASAGLSHSAQSDHEPNRVEGSERCGAKRRPEEGEQGRSSTSHTRDKMRKSNGADSGETARVARELIYCTKCRNRHPEKYSHCERYIRTRLCLSVYIDTQARMRVRTYTNASCMHNYAPVLRADIRARIMHM